MKTLFAVLCIGVLFSVAAGLAPLQNTGSETAIPDHYIVVLNEGMTIEQRDAHVRELTAAHPSATVKRSYAIGKFIAFHAIMDKGALARELEHEDVQYIEADQHVYVSADETKTQTGAEWGLNRISQVDLLLDGQYSYFDSAGQDVCAYVVDTGILLSHDEYAGRAFFGANFVDGETNEDCNGHGTHVAGTIAGKTYGVAKAASLYAVKVLGCGGGGTWTGVIAGIEWVAHNHAKCSKRSVANMSLGGGKSTAVDSAVSQAVATGITFAVAAGNNGLNACNYSPAACPEAFTVGATTNTDNRASYSNYGPCMDVFAPGTNVKSSWIGSNSATSTISGTSMATPHVVGAVACYLGHLAAVDPDGEVPTPAQVKAHLVAVATQNKVIGPGTGSVNKLLFSAFESKI